VGINLLFAAGVGLRRIVTAVLCAVYKYLLIYLLTYKMKIRAWLTDGQTCY